MIIDMKSASCPVKQKRRKRSGCTGSKGGRSSKSEHSGKGRSNSYDVLDLDPKEDTEKGTFRAKTKDTDLERGL